MSKDPDNPTKFITVELCTAMMNAHKEAQAANLKYLEEKIKGLERTVVVGFSVSSFLIMVVEFLLRFV